MAIQTEKKTFPIISHQSITLAKQARLEYLKTGVISVTCPKCHQHPEIKTTSRGERTTITCPCGYIKNIEINF